MASSFTEIRKRQLARLGGAKPPSPRAAMALAKSQAYQDAADAGHSPRLDRGARFPKALREGSCADGGASATGVTRMWGMRTGAI